LAVYWYIVNVCGCLIIGVKMAVYFRFNIYGCVIKDTTMFLFGCQLIYNVHGYLIIDAEIFLFGSLFIYFYGCLIIDAKIFLFDCLVTSMVVSLKS